LVAPPLVHPHEKQEDFDVAEQQEEHKRSGARMERPVKKDQVEQKHRGEEDEPEDIDESSFLQPASKQIEREPEREPDFSVKDMEGNLTHSMLDNEVGVAQKGINGGGGEDLDVSIEASLNISETNESISEMKKDTAIPILKNSERFLNRPEMKMGNARSSLPQKQAPVSFSQRVGSSDPYKIAAQMQLDVNLVSTQVFQLWHKLIEIITINPKFVCELLRHQYEEKMREQWGEHIYRKIVETQDFANHSEENVGEIHR